MLWRLPRVRGAAPTCQHTDGPVVAVASRARRSPLTALRLLPTCRFLSRGRRLASPSGGSVVRERSDARSPCLGWCWDAGPMAAENRHPITGT